MTNRHLSYVQQLLPTQKVLDLPWVTLIVPEFQFPFVTRAEGLTFVLQILSGGSSRYEPRCPSILEVKAPRDPIDIQNLTCEVEIFHFLALHGTKINL